MEIVIVTCVCALAVVFVEGLSSLLSRKFCEMMDEKRLRDGTELPAETERRVRRAKARKQ